MRRAFTLLEILLALAILVGCIAILGELNNQGMQGAHRAAASAKAQLYCESKLAEVLSGVIAPTAVGRAMYELDPAWTYSIMVEPTMDTGLLSVHVTLSENLPTAMSPVEFTLVRWMRDPTLVTQMQTEADAEAEAREAEAEK